VISGAGASLAYLNYRCLLGSRRAFSDLESSWRCCSCTVEVQGVGTDLMYPYLALDIPGVYPARTCIAAWYYNKQRRAAAGSSFGHEYNQVQTQVEASRQPSYEQVTPTTPLRLWPCRGAASRPIEPGLGSRFGAVSRLQHERRHPRWPVPCRVLPRLATGGC
jgi:hypothetical protein